MPEDPRTASPTRPPKRLTLYLGSQLLACGGVMTHEAALELARPFADGAGAGATSSRKLSEALRPLRAAGVVERVGDLWYARNMADLAGWVADGFAVREDTGYAVDPVVPSVPQQREARQAARAA